MGRWYVAATQPAKEVLALRHLRNQGFSAFLPRRAKTVRHARKLLSVMAPLFPGYLFIDLDPGEVRWRSVNGTTGVRHLLTADNRPLPLPVGVVEQLLALSDEEGTVSFAGGLKVDQKVVMLAGPFADRIGTILSLDGKGRVKILLELLSSSVPVSTVAENLMPA